MQKLFLGFGSFIVTISITPIQQLHNTATSCYRKSWPAHSVRPSIKLKKLPQQVCYQLLPKCDMVPSTGLLTSQAKHKVMTKKRDKSERVKTTGRRASVPSTCTVWRALHNFPNAFLHHVQFQAIQPSQCFSTSCTVSSYTTFPMLFYMYNFKLHRLPNTFIRVVSSYTTFPMHNCFNTFLPVQFQATQLSQCWRQAILSCLTPAMAWSASAISRVGQFIIQATGQVNCQMKHSTKIQGVMVYSHTYNMEA